MKAKESSSDLRARQLAVELEFTHQWYAVRWQRLGDLIRDEAPQILDRACSVMANGTADTNDPPNYDEILNRLRYELTLAKSK